MPYGYDSKERLKSILRRGEVQPPNECCLDDSAVLDTRVDELGRRVRLRRCKTCGGKWGTIEAPIIDYVEPIALTKEEYKSALLRASGPQVALDPIYAAMVADQAEAFWVEIQKLLKEKCR